MFVIIILVVVYLLNSDELFRIFCEGLLVFFYNIIYEEVIVNYKYFVLIKIVREFIKFVLE